MGGLQIFIAKLAQLLTIIHKAQLVVVVSLFFLSHLWVLLKFLNVSACYNPLTFSLSARDTELACSLGPELIRLDSNLKSL